MLLYGVVARGNDSLISMTPTTALADRASTQQSDSTLAVQLDTNSRIEAHIVRTSLFACSVRVSTTLPSMASRAT